MRLLFLCLAFMASLGAEAQAFKPRTVSSSDLPVQGELIFVASPDETLAAVKAVLEALDWKLLYDGNELPTKEYAYFSNSAAFSGKSYDRIAWDRSSEGEMPPKWYVQAKTKTTAMSFGAELFVTVFEAPNQGSVVVITASSSQLREKNRLETYIDGFAKELNGKIQ
jgi:hypothetical protein